MAAGNFVLYGNAVKNIATGVIDLDSHTFKAILVTSASNAATLTLNQKSQITNELPTANGYTVGGVTLTGITVNVAGQVVTFDANDFGWNASGGSITARWMVIYDDTAANDELLGFLLMDTTPADVTAPNGQPLTIQLPVSGLFTMTAAGS